MLKTQIHKGMITPSNMSLPQCTVLPKAALLPAIFFLALVPSLRKSRLISTYDLAINNCHPSKIHLHSPKLKE